MRAALYLNVEWYFIYIEKTDTEFDIVRVTTVKEPDTVIAEVQTIGLYDWVNEYGPLAEIILHKNNNNTILLLNEQNTITNYYLNLYKPKQNH